MHPVQPSLHRHDRRQQQHNSSSSSAAASSILNNVPSHASTNHACPDGIYNCIVFSSILFLIASVIAIASMYEEALENEKLVSGAARDQQRHRLIDDINDAAKAVEKNRDGFAFNVERSWVMRSSTIFVSIASFRDVLCRITAEDIFARAINPQRVFLGILEQNEHGDPTCVPPSFLEDENCRADAASSSFSSSSSSSFCPLDNMRRRRLAAQRGQGPTVARYLTTLMYRGESFVMLIDSHNKFRQHWDHHLILMTLQADSPKPVISHYPLAWSVSAPNSKRNGGQQLQQQDSLTAMNNPTYVTVMCRAHATPFGYVRMGGLNFPNSRRPRRQPYIAAGLMFADAAMIHEVPLDPWTPALFDGEELLYGARLFTHGWDSFAPSSNVIYHMYNRMQGDKPAPRFWNIPAAVSRWPMKQQASVRRVQWMLRIPRRGNGGRAEPIVPRDTNETAVIVEADKYGLGAERSLESFWKFAELDVRNNNDQPGVCHQWFKFHP